MNQGRLSLEYLFFSITSILVLSCNDVQMVQKSEWYKIVLIHQLWLHHILSSLSLVFSLWKYMKIKTQRHSSLPYFVLTQLSTLFSFELSNRPWKFFNILHRELSHPLFPSLTPFSFYSIFHCVTAHRNLGCFLTFVFRTNTTVNYLVHTSFLCV